MGKLWDHQEMGELIFSLPGVEQPIGAVAKMPRRYSEHHYVWTGTRQAPMITTTPR
jgi:hypothetical protein